MTGPTTTVELFAGIGGFRVAADLCKLDTVWVNEIDADRCAVYRDRFAHSSLVEGCIEAHVDSVPPHDILTAGFPCQPFSSAGKQQGISDPRGTLFQVIVNTVNRHRPAFFVLENVKRLLEMQRGSQFATILQSFSDIGYRVEWRLLNAAHFGLAQNRQRVFMIGSPNTVEHNADTLLRLGVQEDLIQLDDRQFEQLLTPQAWTPIEKHDKSFPGWGVCIDGHFCGMSNSDFSDKQPPTTVKEILEDKVDDRFDFTVTTLQWIHRNTEINRFIDGVEILSNQGGGARMGYTLFGVNGLAPTLTASTSRHYERYKVDGRYRRLTNVEYARLQGFPDDHCRKVSIYDQYILIGNAVPPPMATWVLEKLLGCGAVLSTAGRELQTSLCLTPAPVR